MKYSQKIVLKDGKEAYLRNGNAVFENFNLTHEETDYLLSYPDENSFNSEQEGQFLEQKTESTNEIEIIALVDGKVAGTAGIEAVGTKYKVKHRAEWHKCVKRLLGAWNRPSFDGSVHKMCQGSRLCSART